MSSATLWAYALGITSTIAATAAVTAAIIWIGTGGPQ